jgi:hypothetical protein
VFYFIFKFIGKGLLIIAKSCLGCSLVTQQQKIEKQIWWKFVNLNIKRTSMYNKLCNKQDWLFSSSRSYLDRGQGPPNEF